MLGVRMLGLSILMLCCRCCGQLRRMLSTITAWTVAGSESVRLQYHLYCMLTSLLLTEAKLCLSSPA